jgi:hypothetical protein
MITYEAVVIGGKSYDSLASIAEADEYLLAEPGPDATAWRALTDLNEKGRNLVGATRIIMRQRIRPELLVDPILPALRDATILLAAAMANGYDAANSATTASGIKRQKAGSVEQEFFMPGIVAGSGGFRFPLSIWELLRGLLDGGADDSGIGGSFASGTCGQSIANIDYGYGSGGYGYGDDNYDRSCE